MKTTCVNLADIASGNPASLPEQSPTLFAENPRADPFSCDERHVKRLRIRPPANLGNRGDFLVRVEQQIPRDRKPPPREFFLRTAPQMLAKHPFKMAS